MLNNSMFSLYNNSNNPYARLAGSAVGSQAGTAFNPIAQALLADGNTGQQSPLKTFAGNSALADALKNYGTVPDKPKSLQAATNLFQQGAQTGVGPLSGLSAALSGLTTGIDNNRQSKYDNQKSAALAEAIRGGDANAVAAAYMQAGEADTAGKMFMQRAQNNFTDGQNKYDWQQKSDLQTSAQEHDSNMQTSQQKWKGTQNAAELKAKENLQKQTFAEKTKEVDKKRIELEAEIAQAQAEADNIQQARELSEKAYSGITGGLRDNFAGVFDPSGKSNNAKLISILEADVMNNLKRKLGGNITDSERKAAMAMSGANLSLTERERNARIDQNLKDKQQKLSELKRQYNSLYGANNNNGNNADPAGIL